MSDVLVPRVSLIAAAYNGERFLRESLESAFAQDFESYEVVFVDDGSDDRTGEIAQSFPVRYVRQPNQGLPSARNAGIAVARGELVAFLDDDDVLVPTKLSTQAGYLDGRGARAGIFFHADGRVCGTFYTIHAADYTGEMVFYDLTQWLHCLFDFFNVHLLSIEIIHTYARSLS